MSIVVTGSLGHISLPIVKQLISGGKDVTVISSNADKKPDIEALGAKSAIGSITDEQFLQATFAGATAVYTTVPPYFAHSDWKGYIESVGKKYADAIKKAGVQYVVNLSSIGADKPAGVGPVTGLHYVEKALNELEGVNVLHLRPGFFYYNFLNNISLIKQHGIIGGNYGNDTKLVLVHTNDIAKVAADALLSLSFSGKSVKYISSDERKTSEVAAVLGAAIGKPALPWVDFKDEDTFGAMVGAGLTEEMAKNYVEMGAAARTGIMFEDYYKNQPARGIIKLETYAKEFAEAYNA
jgi:uncharacterized protein YbjT (DUF2867 family)